MVGQKVNSQKILWVRASEALPQTDEERSSQNPKLEYRNPKQIRMTKIQMLQTKEPPRLARDREFRIWNFKAPEFRFTKNLTQK